MVKRPPKGVLKTPNDKQHKAAHYGNYAEVDK
jgi:hypothetical protein